MWKSELIGKFALKMLGARKHAKALCRMPSPCTKPMGSGLQPKNLELLSQKARGHQGSVAKAAQARNTQAEQSDLGREIIFCLKMCEVVPLVRMREGMKQGKQSGGF